MLLGCPKQLTKHSSAKLKVIYIKHFLFCARINYQFKTSELKNVEKLVEPAVQAFKVLLEWTENYVHFNTICEIAFLVHVGGRNFLYEP